MQTLTINNNQLTVKEYKGQRVVTFKDIDTVHGRAEGTARKRFNDNKSHFIQGIDYFVRNSDEAKSEYKVIAPNGLILVTETGYLMLVKSFTDDLAWAVQRQLVSEYFNNAVAVKTQLPEETYVYKEKRYKGAIVASIRDITHLWPDASKEKVTYYLKNFCIINRDYYRINGLELAEFKRANNFSGSEKAIKEMFVVTYCGLQKLASFIGNKNYEPIKKFQLSPPKKEEKLVVDVPTNDRAQLLIASAKGKVTAITELLGIINRYNNAESHLSYCETLATIAGMIYTVCNDLRRLEIKMVPERK